MSKGLITAIVFGLIVMFGGFWACNKRNGFVGLREDAKAQWQQVESQYQRRMDLIPNIVATVKGEANFEKSTLEAVVAARASATQVKVNLDDINEASIAKYKAAQGELSNALGRLLMVTENYPNLKSNQAFSDLRVELEGCENRIATERMKYNNMSRDYNKAIQMFPGSLLAGGFAPMAYFEAEAGAEKAPKVEF
ncbi:MAG TPA: LemA family protein [Bacteroidia bacterium]|nr:LemA family protein [Bacteroidia bacterium]HRD39347.1 LemA family protein [Bacteroidia bacterium]